MNHSTAVRPRLRAWIAALLTALFVVTGLSVGSTAAQAATGDVAGATLHWGIKESFRSYIAGPIANGSTELSGGVTGAFDWSSGTGSADEAADTGAVAYPGSIHFLGHGGALDLTFSNVRVQQSSPTSAVIVLDTAAESNVVFATVDLASATSTTTVGTVAYSGAPAVLTAAGATSFAGFYSEGTALDPVTFSWPVEQAPVVVPPAPVVPTITVSPGRGSCRPARRPTARVPRSRTSSLARTLPSASSPRSGSPARERPAPLVSPPRRRPSGLSTPRTSRPWVAPIVALSQSTPTVGSPSS